MLSIWTGTARRSMSLRDFASERSAEQIEDEPDYLT